MDALEQSDIDDARRATPAEKLAQALELMADLDDAALENLYFDWLFADD